MKLAYLDPHPLPDTIPEALQILQTVDALGTIGIKVALVCPQSGTAPAADSILGRPLSDNVSWQTVRDYRQAWWYPKNSNYLFYRLAVAWLRAHPIDAILVRNLKLAEALLKAALPIPIFFETHEVFAQSFHETHGLRNERTMRKYHQLEKREAFVYQHVAGLMGLTQLLLDDIQQIYAVHCPLKVAPDGVDTQLAQAAQQVSITPRATPVLLYLGSLHPWKGVETLIQMLPHLRTPVELWIAGGIASRIAELRQLAQSLNVSQAIRFLGEIPPIQRFELIQQATMCLLPLKHTSIGARYTSPLKLFEYLAMGKPVIASDLPAMHEVLIHGENAWLVEAESPLAWSTAIQTLLADKPLQAKLAKNAKMLAQAYTWQHRAQIIRDFIHTQLPQ